MLGFTLGATIMPVIAVAQQRAAVQTIPNVLGRPVKEATDSLARTNLPIVQIVVRTDTVRSGIVVAQRPPAGTPVTRVRVESLWVTSPVRRTTVDSRAVSVARATPPPSRTSDDVTSTPGNVVVNLAADSALTRVNVPGIVVRERTKVPDLFRKTPQQVAADLKRHKLRPGKESRDYSDDVAPGLVFRQHPPPGADGEVLAGTMVDVWYSVGPHPQPPSLVIPSVVGLALREAGDSLRRVGLGIGHVDRIVVPGIRDRVYSGIPASMFGMSQRIEISHVSGMSNVKYWLAEHGYDANDEGLCQHVFALAKTTDRVLTDEEIHICCNEYANARRQASA
jgi:beta-lactam-binding protein with PASTA domain